MNSPQEDRHEYRCCIAAENSAGKLKIGGRLFDVCVVDTSRTEFGIRVPNAVAKRLKGKRRPQLLYAGETWEVEPTTRFSEDSQYTQLGLARIRDLTKIPMPRSWPFSAFHNPATQSDPTFLAFLIVAFLVAVLCLPGIGDSLGTAPRVRDAIESVVE